MNTTRLRLLSIALAAGIALAPTIAHADSMPDAWITTQVKSGLLGAEGISSRKIHVDTINGSITLYGTVGTQAESTKAEAIARKVEGTINVRNLLQVVPQASKASTTAADDVIKNNVVSSLKSDPALADSKITVRSVNNGVVLLSGTAKTLSDHLRAMERTSRVEGVRQVASEIKSPNRLEDAEIWRDGIADSKVAERSAAADMWTTSAVKMRLLVNTESPGFDINVDTVDGVVTLFGVVETAKAKDAAAAEARKVGSAKSVVNELQVVAPAAQSVVAAKDASTQDVLRKRLDTNTELKDCHITIDVKNGVVHVTGTVASHGDRITALTVVRTTAGVRGLVDDLTVAPTKVTSR